MLAKTDENFISIDMGYAKACDMFRFFYPLNLDAIKKTFSNEECVILNKQNLERRKCLFSYEWLNRIDKFNEFELPPIAVFHSKLKQNDFTDEEYEQAKRCWEECGCKTIKDCMLLYLKTDWLLSVDVFERFRDMCLEYYETDQCYTFSNPDLTWIWGLKYFSVIIKYYEEETVIVYDTILQIIWSDSDSNNIGYIYIYIYIYIYKMSLNKRQKNIQFFLKKNNS